MAALLEERACYGAVDAGLSSVGDACGPANLPGIERSGAPAISRIIGRDPDSIVLNLDLTPD